MNLSRSQLVSNQTKSLANVSVRGTFAGKAHAPITKSLTVVRCSEDPNAPVPVEQAVAAAVTTKKEPYAMNFNGFAPETINGRLAQVGIVAGLGAEISSGESFATQFHDHPIAFGLACTLITAATFMPAMQQATEYNSNPTSKEGQVIFNADAEKLNGRAAMIGMVAILATEYLKGGALFGGM